MKNERNHGIDLLRITATLMICIYHMLGVGGIMLGTEYLSGHWAAAWGLEKLMLGCVNCYGLISGYVGVDSKYRPSRWFNQWLQVMFYSAGITLLFQLVRPETVSSDQIIRSLLPVGTSQYWYFSSYTGLFLLMPILNHIINTMDGRALGRVLMIALPLFGLSTMFEQDALVLHSGYSTLWLILLYLCGGWIRRYGQKKHSARFWGLVFLLTSFGMLGMKMVSDYTFLHFNFRILQRLYGSFSSPAVLLAAVALLKIFSNLSIQSKWMKRTIERTAPACFGVYLIHVHPCVWQHVLKDAFRWVAECSILPMLLMTLAVSAGVFVLCLVIDLVRIQLFRVLRIHQLTEAACTRIQSVLHLS